MCIGLQVKYPLFSSYFNETWIFSTDFREILWYQILWKSFPVAPCGRTYLEVLVVASRNFANAPHKKKKMKIGERWTGTTFSLSTKWLVLLPSGVPRPRGSVFITRCVSKGCAALLSQDASARVQQEVTVVLPPSTLAPKSHKIQIRVMTCGSRLWSVVINWPRG